MRTLATFSLPRALRRHTAGCVGERPGGATRVNAGPVKANARQAAPACASNAGSGFAIAHITRGAYDPRSERRRSAGASVCAHLAARFRYRPGEEKTSADRKLAGHLVTTATSEPPALRVAIPNHVDSAGRYSAPEPSSLATRSLERGVVSTAKRQPVEEASGVTDEDEIVVTCEVLPALNRASASATSGAIGTDLTFPDFGVVTAAE